MLCASATTSAFTTTATPDSRSRTARSHSLTPEQPRTQSPSGSPTTTQPPVSFARGGTPSTCKNARPEPIAGVAACVDSPRLRRANSSSATAPSTVASRICGGLQRHEPPNPAPGTAIHGPTCSRCVRKPTGRGPPQSLGKGLSAEFRGCRASATRGPALNRGRRLGWSAAISQPRERNR